MAKFMQQRGVKKLLKDRLAVVSMWVIGAYLLVALGVLVGNLFTEGGLKSETELRIGPDNVPGAWATQSAEARLRDATFYLDSIKKASRGSDPAAAYAALEWGSDRLPAWKPDRIESEIIEPADEISTALADHRELEGNVEALALLDRLEQVVRARIGASHDESGNAQRSAGQSFRMLLGTDRQGRSILVRAIYSTKVAVQIGVVSALISVLIGTILGAAAGYFGGVVDVIVVWLYSTFSSIPWIVLLMVLASAFRGGDWDGTLIPVYAAFCLSFWISPCRVVRGEVMKLKELEYVQAASAIGFGRARILFKHVIPNTAHLMFINFSLLFIGAIKAEVILSFLGLGVKNEPSWGVMINHAKAEVLNGFFWQIGTATVFMVILVLAFNTLSDALQDAFDPKHV
ncbi:MAG: ABC transporter permease [Planctomycetes bacterium]|nr:ABC transporter permease [Planctomycetota bacterium]MCB9903384.1 ABC transporter permease [Planctomycetota bacterium]